MADLLQPYIPNVSGMLSAQVSGYTLGAAQKKRADDEAEAAREKALNQQAGGLLASGNMRGARDVLYKAGDLARGGQIDAQLRAAAKEARTEQLEKAAKFNAMLGNIAMLADTPEKWQQAVAGLEQRGLDVSKYRDFGARNFALAQAGQAKEVLEMELARRKVDVAAEAGKAKADAVSTPLQKALAQKDAKTQQDYADASQTAGDLAEGVGALKDARARTNFEGSWFNNAATRAIGRNIGGGLGIIPTSKDVQALDQIEAASGGLTRQAAESLKGALSDRDLAFLQQQQPGGSMTDAAAEAPLAIIQGGGLRAQARAEMYDAWLQANGSARGFQEAWNRYRTDNPVVAKDAAGNTVYRVQPRDWRQYMSPGGGSVQQGNPAADIKAMSDDDLRKALGL